MIDSFPNAGGESGGRPPGEEIWGTGGVAAGGGGGNCGGLAALGVPNP